ncbi:CPBP family intramembrane glutamic endopeptidase [Haladaptatus sp. DYF46]|uniref:CPBP family intramembrane glutamic endopeptidase n=1 Tax=Haladaptatus sp. DYF46 TaxID=2886041 RepID=UPI001E61DB24|nr:CPBP family intramembrane glutamic endopeptidase [Haladaptatus sp. DYF46]
MEMNPDTVGDNVSTESGRRSSPGRAVGVAVVVTVLAVVVNTIGSIATLIPLVLLDFAIDSPPAFLALLVGGQTGFLVAGYAVARYRKMAIPISRPNGRQIGIAFGGAAIAIVIASALWYLVESLGLAPGSVIENVAVNDPSLFLWIAGLSVVLIAPVEEFLFRGVVQGTLREAFGPVGAIVGASLLFGSLHLANFTGEVATLASGVALLIVTGAVFGVLYEWTDSLTVPIVAHAAYNAILLTGSYVVAA